MSKKTRRPPTPKRARGRTRRTPGKMNKLEESYSKELERRRLAGEIHAWAFEPMNFRLAHRCYYKPDFMVIMADGTVEFHEAKGHFEEQSKVRTKVVAEKHPWFVFRLVRRLPKKQGGGFDIAVIGPFPDDDESEAAA